MSETNHTLNRHQRQKLKRRRENKGMDTIQPRGGPVAGTSKKPKRKD